MAGTLTIGRQIRLSIYGSLVGDFGRNRRKPTLTIRRPTRACYSPNVSVAQLEQRDELQLDPSLAGKAYPSPNHDEQVAGSVARFPI